MLKLGTSFFLTLLLCGGLSPSGLSLAEAQEDLPSSSVNENPFSDERPSARPDFRMGDEQPYGGVRCPTNEELNEWFKPLNRVQISKHTADGRMPIDCSTDLFYKPTGGAGQTAPARHWASSEFHWQASNLAAQPAYWDDVPLERYGQTVSPLIQPGISGAKFFGTFFIIPYKIGVDRTHDLIYTLGYYRPGSPTPAVRQTLPWEWDAAAFQAASVVGMVFILP